MKPVRQEIEVACDPGSPDSRCWDPYLRLAGDGWVLEASNRYIAVRIPVECKGKERLTAGAIPTEALREARREGKHITVQKTQVKVGDRTYKRPKRLSPPDLPYGSGTEHTVAFSASSLYTIAQALGVDLVTLAYDDRSREVTVTPVPGQSNAREGAVGVLVRLVDENVVWKERQQW